MSARRWRAPGLALLGAWATLGCAPRDEAYPPEWPKLAWSWTCPDLAGQWRLGGRTGLDMGVLGDARLLRVYGETPVAWDVIAISFDRNKRMTIRLSRSTVPGSDPDQALPRALHEYAARHLGKRVSREAQARHYENHLDRDLYQCSGNKLTIAQWGSAGETGSIFLAKDKKGNLVGGRIERSARTEHTWSHWPAITPAEVSAVEDAAAVQSQGFDAGPLDLGPPGARDVDDMRAEATAELEGGAKVIALRAAGGGAVLATIQGPDEWSIHSALDRVVTARVYKLELRRYDPSRDGAYQADVLLSPLTGAARMP